MFDELDIKLYLKYSCLAETQFHFSHMCTVSEDHPITWQDTIVEFTLQNHFPIFIFLNYFSVMLLCLIDEHYETLHMCNRTY